MCPTMQSIKTSTFFPPFFIILHLIEYLAIFITELIVVFCTEIDSITLPIAISLNGMTTVWSGDR